MYAGPDKVASRRITSADDLPHARKRTVRETRRTTQDKSGVASRTEPYEEFFEHGLRPDSGRAIRLVGIAQWVIVQSYLVSPRSL